MNIPKCRRTATGKHRWIMGMYDECFKCEYCGLIDDRKGSIKINKKK